MRSLADVQATYCATLVDEWVAGGVTHAVVSPGSRSTPLALALANDQRVRVHVVHDERSAGFMALGIGLATGRPAPVVTTSGTAAVELHPSVVEAHHGRVPMLVCTADRPRRLWGTGAPQTIDQTRLYGAAVRWFVEPGVPDDADRDGWRDLARRMVAEASGPVPGPVHLNQELDEPLVGTPGPLPAGEGSSSTIGPAASDAGVDAVDIDSVADALRAERGVVIAGGRRVGPEVLALASGLGWPVLTDAQAAPVAADLRIGAADAILRHPGFAAAHRPDTVVWVGERPASRVVEEWVASARCTEVALGPPVVPDPGRRAAVTIEGSEESLARSLLDAIEGARGAGDWQAAWAAADRTAAAAADEVLSSLRPGLSEPGVARRVVDGAPDGTTVMVSSSMPIRDVEWWCRPPAGVAVRANRGANGIDGVVSTAVGLALGSGQPVRALVGDLAFLHDSGALTALSERGAEATVVVVDNDGGGIFSFLPQAGTLDPATFERLFGTPHGTDLVALARAHGIAAVEVTDDDALAAALSVGGSGPRVVVARTDRGVNVEVHRRLVDAVAVALSRQAW